MSSEPDVARLAAVLSREIAADPLGVKAAWLDGSRARGTARRDSDVDVAILQRQPLRSMVGFRNVLVHGYADVRVRVVREVVESRLGDLTAFVAAIRSRLASNG